MIRPFPVFNILRIQVLAAFLVGHRSRFDGFGAGQRVGHFLRTGQDLADRNVIAARWRGYVNSIKGPGKKLVVMVLPAGILLLVGVCYERVLATGDIYVVVGKDVIRVPPRFA